jgi:hypothetical protein
MKAARENDVKSASTVYNQAALIASDCGQPYLAREWCHRHANAYLRISPRGAWLTRLALEPFVNLARLHIRTGDGDIAFRLIDTLYESITNRVDTAIDGIAIPAAALTGTDRQYRFLRQWLWAVHLADGTRALTSAGRWQEAEAHLQRRNGIGRRMLDGRQTSVIARATAGNTSAALELLAHTATGPAWENGVTRCLTVLCHEPRYRPVHELIALFEDYRRLEFSAPTIVFVVRLGLTIIDAASRMEDLDPTDIVKTLIRHVIDSGDGYAARDVLVHGSCISRLRDDQKVALERALRESGLGHQIPKALHRELEFALQTCEFVIAGCPLK